MTVIPTRMEEKEWRLKVLIANAIGDLQSAARFVDSRQGEYARGRLVESTKYVNDAHALIDELMEMK